MESQLSDPEALSVNATAKKGSDLKTSSATNTKIKADTMANSATEIKDNSASSKSDKSGAFEWEEVKKARNRINSQRIRERERTQIANLEAERARLWLSNDAIKFQNRHFREIVAQILEVREMKRNRAAGMGMRGPGAPGPSAALAASLGGLGGGPGMQMSLGMRHNADMMGGLGGGLDASGLFQNPRLTAASSKGLSGLSDADLLARHQATSMEVQNMMRQKEAMERFGSAGGVGMGGLGLNNGMGLNNSMNMNTNTNMNTNMNMNMNAGSASAYGDIAENLRIRQLMLQQSGAPSDGLLSPVGGRSFNPLGNNIGGGDAGNNNGNGLALSGGGLGDLGGGMGEVDIFQMNKRQKFGL